MLLIPIPFKQNSSKPFAPFLNRMAMGILPRHLLQDVDINKTPFNRSPIGTGPYKFRSWQAAQYVQLERYDGYHLGTPKLNPSL